MDLKLEQKPLVCVFVCVAALRNGIGDYQTTMCANGLMYVCVMRNATFHKICQTHTHTDNNTHTQTHTHTHEY